MGGAWPSGRRRLVALFALGAVLTALQAAAPVEASFHLIKVREVYAGSNNDSYVELQMFAGGQQFVEGHPLTLYDSTGALVHTSTFPTPSGVSNGANQATVLIGDSNVGTAFGVAPDLVDAGLNVPATAGAACWLAGTLNADCVAWGGFSGGAPFESATGTGVGTPVSTGGITAGKAILRTIAPGCSTLFEAADDSDDSATDFSEQTPNPRNNTSPITETACTAPAATIDSKPSNPTNSITASFTYHSTPAGAEFECRLDTEAFASCTSGGKSYAGPLSEGSHTFQVRAHNVNGTGSPAGYTWTVDTTPPTSTIDTHPNDPSPGGSASFTFHSSETGSTFECSLTQGVGPDSFSACSSGKTYTSLEDGAHTFKVRATDKAANQGTPAAFSWTVDNSLLDTTPPETTILSRPPNPSSSSTASFTYESNEPESSFECRLDTGAFAPCPPSGIAYAGLANGSHNFAVRAIDPSANVDPTPAGYTFDVVFASAASAPPSPAPSPLPPTEPRPGTAFAAGLARVKGAAALLRMGCRGEEGARCSGALRLLTRSGGARSSRRAARSLTIGRATYNLPAGSQRGLVRARLTRRGRRLVARAGARGLKVSLAGKALKRQVLTLRAGGGKRRARR